MIVTSLRGPIITTVASKQKHGMSKVFQEQENIVEENLLQKKFGHMCFHKKMSLS